MLQPGRGLGLVLGISTAILILIFIRLTKNGTIKPKLRKLPAIEAISECVGRAAEMGRPVMFIPGETAGLNTEFGPMVLAGIYILGHLAELCAKYDVKLIVPINQPDVVPVAREMVFRSYIKAGKQEAYKEDNIWLAGSGSSYNASVIGRIKSEEIAANIMIGPFYSGALMYAETASQLGAIQIGGSGRLMQVPYFIASCDYVLIAEEVYIGGAYISGDPIFTGAAAGQDIIKWACMGLIAIAVILNNIGVKWLTDLLKI